MFLALHVSRERLPVVLAVAGVALLAGIVVALCA
jgi:hypothetical protein